MHCYSEHIVISPLGLEILEHQLLMRYRERKKAKLQSQSKDVEDLTQQMQDFDGLNAGVRAMETRKAALEQDLWSKEAEIERIK